MRVTLRLGPNYQISWKTRAGLPAHRTSARSCGATELTAGLSQEALAERAGMSAHGISALERGYRRTPQRATLALLAGALALSTGNAGNSRRPLRVRSVLGRRRASVTVGPWPDAANASLPFALTNFVGRERELDEIATLVREHRMVTLTGAGGVGKTQTALKSRRRESDADRRCRDFRRARVDRRSFARHNSGRQRAWRTRGSESPAARDAGCISEKQDMLLVLDNCEHVIAEAATVADSLLRGCPNLRILATSREPLRAAGERAYRLPSLDDNDAVALFADRAQAAEAHFA